MLLSYRDRIALDAATLPPPRITMTAPAQTQSLAHSGAFGFLRRPCRVPPTDPPERVGGCRQQHDTRAHPVPAVARISGGYPVVIRGSPVRGAEGAGCLPVGGRTVTLPPPSG